MTLLKKTKNWFFDNRYGLLAAFVGFIFAGISFALLWSLGYASELSFVWGLSSWAILGIAAACSYVTGGLLATLAFTIFPIKESKIKHSAVNRLTQGLKGIFFPITAVATLAWAGVKYLLVKIRWEGRLFHYAAKNGNVDEVKSLLQMGADVNATGVFLQDGIALCGPGRSC